MAELGAVVSRAFHCAECSAYRHACQFAAANDIAALALLRSKESASRVVVGKKQRSRDPVGLDLPSESIRV